MEEDHPVLDRCGRQLGQDLVVDERRDAGQPAEVGDGGPDPRLRLVIGIVPPRPCLGRGLDHGHDEIDAVVRPREGEQVVLVVAGAERCDLLIGESRFHQLGVTPVVEDARLFRPTRPVRTRQRLSPLLRRHGNVDEAHEPAVGVHHEPPPGCLVVDVATHARLEQDDRVTTTDEEHAHVSSDSSGPEL